MTQICIWVFTPDRKTPQKLKIKAEYLKENVAGLLGGVPQNHPPTFVGDDGIKYRIFENPRYGLGNDDFNLTASLWYRCEIINARVLVCFNAVDDTPIDVPTHLTPKHFRKVIQRKEKDDDSDEFALWLGWDRLKEEQKKMKSKKRKEMEEEEDEGEDDYESDYEYGDEEEELALALGYEEMEKFDEKFN